MKKLIGYDNKDPMYAVEGFEAFCLWAVCVIGLVCLVLLVCLFVSR